MNKQFLSKFVFLILNFASCFANDDSDLLLEADRLHKECLLIANESFKSLISTMKDQELVRDRLIEKWDELFFSKQQAWLEKEKQISDLKSQISLLEEQRKSLEKISDGKNYILVTIQGYMSIFPFNSGSSIGFRIQYPFQYVVPFFYANAYMSFHSALHFGFGFDIVFW